MNEAGIEFPPDLRDARHLSQLRKEAFHATQARAAGGSSAEIREIYVAEMRARSLKIPPEQIVDALVERINGELPRHE